jgi:hypothetical protein
MSNWARSGWTSRGRDNRHGREQLHGPDQQIRNRAGRCAATATAKRCAAEEPQDLRLSGRGIARDRGGALQLDRQEDAGTAGSGKGPAAAAHLAGQHRQQRAGVEEPASGRTTERAATGKPQLALSHGRSCAASATPAQRAAAAAYGPTGVAVPVFRASPASNPAYGPRVQGNGAQPQLSPEQQQAQLIAAKSASWPTTHDFASNLVYARAQTAVTSSGPGSRAAQVRPRYCRPARKQSSLQSPRAPGEPQESSRRLQTSRGGNIDSASGQPYLVYEGYVLDTVLMNRLDGDAVGPVKVLVSNPLVFA